MLTEELEQWLVLNSERLEIVSGLPKHNQRGRKDKSTLRVVSRRAAKQKGTTTEKKSFSNSIHREREIFERVSEDWL